jgi:hypothetical protein
MWLHILPTPGCFTFIMLICSSTVVFAISDMPVHRQWSPRSLLHQFIYTYPD